jgi:hypothetical protein
MVLANVELQATCCALGYLEDNNYIKEPDCLGMLCINKAINKWQTESCCGLKSSKTSIQEVQDEIAWL